MLAEIARASASEPQRGRAQSAATTRLLTSILPLLPEKSRRNDLSRIALVRRRRGIDDCIVGNLRNLPCVVEVVVFAEREAAVQHHVLLRVERIRINQNRRVSGRRPLLAA